MSQIAYNEIKDISLDQKTKHSVRILLLGTGDCGKTTIIKQMKVIFLLI